MAGRSSGWRRSCAAILLACASAAVAQQPSSAGVPQARGAAAQWVVDESGHGCAMTRELGGKPTARLVVRSIPGSGEYDVLLVSTAWQAVLGRKKRNDLRLRHGPAGPNYQRAGAILPVGRGHGEAIRFGALPATLLDELARSSALTLARGSDAIADYSVPMAGAAVRAFAECEAAKLVAWGADPAGFEPGAVRPRPIGNPAKWLHDYEMLLKPTPPIRLVVRMNLDAEGRAKRHVVIESDGSPGVALAADIIAGSARYEPARDKSGRPIASVAVYRGVVPRD